MTYAVCCLFAVMALGQTLYFDQLEGMWSLDEVRCPEGSEPNEFNDFLTDNDENYERYLFQSKVITVYRKYNGCTYEGPVDYQIQGNRIFTSPPESHILQCDGRPDERVENKPQSMIFYLKENSSAEDELWIEDETGDFCTERKPAILVLRRLTLG